MRHCLSLLNVYFALRNVDFSNCAFFFGLFWVTVSMEKIRYFYSENLLSEAYPFEQQIWCNGKLCWDNSSGTTFETVCVSRLRPAGT